MSEPARQTPSPEAGLRSPSHSGPLRDWLAAMRAVTGEAASTEEPRAPESTAAVPQDSAEAAGTPEELRTRVARAVSAPRAPAAPGEEGIAEIMAENMMLKARLRLEDERRDELQHSLAREMRDLRAHINEELARIEELREDRDLWRARCEALAQPLFQGSQRR